jgi:hypothetical protein
MGNISCADTVMANGAANNRCRGILKSRNGRDGRTSSDFIEKNPEFLPKKSGERFGEANCGDEDAENAERGDWKECSSPSDSEKGANWVK